MHGNFGSQKESQLRQKMDHLRPDFTHDMFMVTFWINILAGIVYLMFLGVQAAYLKLYFIQFVIAPVHSSMSFTPPPLYFLPPFIQ